MKLTREKNKKSASSLSFSGIGGKTREVARASSSYLLYPKLITFLLVSAFALLVVRVYFSNQLAVSGGFVSVSEGKIASLTKENYQLENKLSQLSSLSYIEAKASQLGMIRVSKMEVLKNGSGVALKQ